MSISAGEPMAKSLQAGLSLHALKRAYLRRAQRPTLYSRNLLEDALLTFHLITLQVYLHELGGKSHSSVFPS